MLVLLKRLVLETNYEVESKKSSQLDRARKVALENVEEIKFEGSEIDLWELKKRSLSLMTDTIQVWYAKVSVKIRVIIS